MSDKNEKNSSYISGKESRRISKFNRRVTKKLERDRADANKDPALFTTKMKDENNVVEFDNVCTYFFTDVGTVKAVDGVSFVVPKCSTVGVVGESGCGKSVTSLSLMQLLQRPQGQTVGGEIRFNLGDGTAYNIVNTPTAKMQEIRGNKISMIFQEPMTSLNPIFTIGNQMDEVMFIHYPETSKEEAKKHSIEMLKTVGISMPERVYNSYPHELSGGMRQRVMIAMALSGNPKLIIADEPTTALDVTIQAQILDLLKSIQKKTGCAIMLITHDLGVIAEMADEVVVMYAGRVIEKGTVREIFYTPKHPYTIGLQKSKPLITSDANEPLYSIPGQVPNPINMPDYCFFKDRCNRCTKACDGHYPTVSNVSPTHLVYCHLYDNQNKGGNDEK